MKFNITFFYCNDRCHNHYWLYFTESFHFVIFTTIVCWVVTDLKFSEKNINVKVTDDSESLVHFIFIIISLPRKMSPRLTAYTHISYFQTSHHTKGRASTHLQYISRDGKYHVLKLSLRSFPLPKMCTTSGNKHTCTSNRREREHMYTPRNKERLCEEERCNWFIYWPTLFARR